MHNFVEHVYLSPEFMVEFLSFDIVAKKVFHITQYCDTAIEVDESRMSLTS